MKEVLIIYRYIFISTCILLWSCKKNTTEPVLNYIEPDMISIDKNLRFTYGPSWDTTFVSPDTLPMLQVELGPYEIGKYELSNEEYEKFVRDGGYQDSTYWSDEGWYFRKNEKLMLPLYWSEDKLWLDDPHSNKKDTPVHGISFYEAEAYCKWLTIKTNNNYHLPSSYQWVRAAKGPDPGTRYPWGNDYNRSLANFIVLWDKVSLVEVSSFEEGKSIEGCFNMIGNVFEICLLVQPLSMYKISVEIFSSYSELASSSGDPTFRTMITTNSKIVEKELRFYAVGFRVAKG